MICTKVIIFTLKFNFHGECGLLLDVSECVLDEAKVTMSVEFIKNLPMPEELKVSA